MKAKHTSITDLYAYFQSCTGVSIDSRSVQVGEMFFALRGPNFDGHHYIDNALTAGAKYVVIEDARFVKDQITILVVNVEKALQDLARFHRLHLTIPIIGLTGSNGKTTTKELLASILTCKYRTFATKGNLNNHLGVPISILSITQLHEIAVIEMGANHVGEIKYLSEIAMPVIGLITNIGKAHLEGFGGIEGVRKGKTELYDYLRKTGGQILYNAQDPYLIASLEKADLAIGYDCDEMQVMQSFPSLTLDIDGHEIRSSLTGAYNVLNIAAAIAVAQYYKVPPDDIAAGIEAYIPDNNRSQIHKTDSNTLILDAYNANPSSMIGSIDNLSSAESNRKVLIIGHMLELGSTSHQEHQELVNYIALGDWYRVFLVGSLFATCEYPDWINYHEDTVSLSVTLKEKSLQNCTILLKGSRGIALEKLIPYL